MARPAVLVLLLVVAALRSASAEVSFEPHRGYPVPPSALAFVAADLNRDGAVDIVVVTRVGVVSVLRGDGLGAFGPPTDVFSRPGTDTVVVGDLNGDGILDLVVGNTAANTVSVLIGDGVTLADR